MNHFYKLITFVFIFALISANAYIFVNGISLSNEVTHFETETKKLYTENMDLETKVYALDSLKFASSVATQLNFTRNEEPIYMNGLSYARR